MRWPVTRRQLLWVVGSVFLDFTIVLLSLPILGAFVALIGDTLVAVTKVNGPAPIYSYFNLSELRTIYTWLTFSSSTILLVIFIARRRWRLIKKNADPTTQRLMEAGEKLVGRTED